MNPDSSPLTPPALDDLVEEQFAIRTTSKEGALCATWTGRANLRRPGPVLTPYLEGLTEQAAEGQQDLEMRFERMEHFNSATIAVLMQALRQATERGVRVRIVYAARLKWQAMTFDALRRLKLKEGMLEIVPE